MKEIKETTYKGTRIILGNHKRKIITNATNYLVQKGFTEIAIPVIQLSKTFAGKIGEENNNLMFNFTDRGNRNICLAPEYTSVIQQLSKTYFKTGKNVQLFYVQECFRGEKPQAGRYRQFTQLGVEIVNPERVSIEQLILIASSLLTNFFHLKKFTIDTDVRRGLDYYNNGRGFEIIYNGLGSSKQICGGGEYNGGMGFAIGVDRVLSIGLPIKK